VGSRFLGIRLFFYTTRPPAPLLCSLGASGVLLVAVVFREMPTFAPQRAAFASRPRAVAGYAMGVYVGEGCNAARHDGRVD
jgi:hypothetical protein